MCAFDLAKWGSANSPVPGEGVSGSHSAVVFNDGRGEKIWVIGGYSAGRAQGNAWAFDGTAWEAMAGIPQDAGRVEHGAAVLKDPRDDKQKIWISGGFDGAGAYANDLWVYTPQILPTASSAVTKFVFVTSSQYEADLAADARCQERAVVAGFKGIYRAWLSASNRSPSSLASFAQYNVPYVLLDGAKIAENWQGIVDGYLQAPINLTEEKKVVSDRYVWTATNVRGKLDEGSQHCENWSTNETPIYISAKLGNTSFKDPRWTESGTNIYCVSERSLYCFEQ